MTPQATFSSKPFAVTKENHISHLPQSVALVSSRPLCSKMTIAQLEPSSRPRRKAFVLQPSRATEKTHSISIYIYIFLSTYQQQITLQIFPSLKS